MTTRSWPALRALAAALTVAAGFAACAPARVVPARVGPVETAATVTTAPVTPSPEPAYRPDPRPWAERSPYARLAAPEAGAFVAEAFTPEAAARQEAEAWNTVLPRVLARIRPPEIPERRCVVTDFGARPDSTDHDDRPAILAALDACARAGGGRVVLPPGDYLSNGPVHFRDRIALHLERGAVLRFGTDPAFYTPLVLVRWEGTFSYNYSPLLYGRGVRDVAITGEGVIDGQTAGAWSAWKRDNDGRNQETPGNKPRLRAMGNEGVPVEDRVFGHGSADPDGDGVDEGDGQPRYLRPGLVHFLESRNVLVEGVTLRGSPFWTTHFVLCENVIVRNATIRPGTTNDDGIDPESSRYVLIEGNDIQTDDDGIAIKAGRDADGRRYPGTAYVVIRNNRFRSRVGGAISIGSEMSGGVSWVFAESNVADNERAHGFYIKSNLDRGGAVAHVYVRDFDVLSASDGFIVTSDYHSYRGGNFPVDVRDIFLRGVRVWNASAVSIRLLGVQAAPVRRIHLADVTVRGAAALPVFRHARDVLASGVVVGTTAWTPGLAADAPPANVPPPRY